jgi:3-deoxy-D-manno-octulosonate 8-phosphate phosphatase (KDO 8-P phosphatase)
MILSRKVLRARKIIILLMDVDGTLTDGRIFVLPDGREIKAYHVHDGLGIFLAKMAGLKVGIITGKSSPGLEKRAERLGIEELHQGVLDKKKVLLEIAGRHGLSLDRLAYIGDDLGDLGVMKLVGLPAAVADAHPAVKRVAHYVCRTEGGSDAVREFSEFILKAQGKGKSLEQKAKEIKRGFQNS